MASYPIRADWFGWQGGAAAPVVASGGAATPGYALGGRQASDPDYDAAQDGYPAGTFYYVVTGFPLSKDGADGVVVTDEASGVQVGEWGLDAETRSVFAPNGPVPCVPGHTVTVRCQRFEATDPHTDIGDPVIITFAAPAG